MNQLLSSSKASLLNSTQFIKADIEDCISNSVTHEGFRLLLGTELETRSTAYHFQLGTALLLLNTCTPSFYSLGRCAEVTSIEEHHSDLLNLIGQSPWWEQSTLISSECISGIIEFVLVLAMIF